MEISIASNSLLVAYAVGNNYDDQPHVLGRTFIVPYTDYITGNHWLQVLDKPYGIFDLNHIKMLQKWIDEKYNNKYILPKLSKRKVKFEFPSMRVYYNDNLQNIQK